MVVGGLLVAAVNGGKAVHYDAVIIIRMTTSITFAVIGRNFDAIGGNLYRPGHLQPPLFDWQERRHLVVLEPAVAWDDDDNFVERVCCCCR